MDRTTVIGLVLSALIGGVAVYGFTSVPTKDPLVDCFCQTEQVSPLAPMTSLRPKSRPTS